MLLKLSISSMKKMKKDYIVLLTGLIISIAIFYMFQTLALNSEFTMKHSVISSIVFVFQIGSILVALITFFYIFYANGFLLSLKQKELGMYLTLGAKRTKVSYLLFFETITIGSVSLVLGNILGVFLSNFVRIFLTKILEISAIGYQAFYIPASKITFLFFSVLFCITALVNVIHIRRRTELELLRPEQESKYVQITTLRTLLFAVCSLLGIGAGYYIVTFIGIKGAGDIILPLFLITFGTYFLFISLFPVLIHRLKQTRYLHEQKLYAFTFAQLQFRVRSLAKILGTVAMLIGLGVGAMAGGMALQQNVTLKAKSMPGYDIILHDPVAADFQAMENMKILDKKQYTYKVNHQGVYYIKEDLLANPPLLFGKRAASYVEEQLPFSQYKMFLEGQKDFSSAELPSKWRQIVTSDFQSNLTIYNRKPVYIIDKVHYEAIQGNTHTFFIGKVDNILNYTTALKEMELRQIEKIAALTTKPKRDIHLMTNYGEYESMLIFSKGTAFMGFFLGISFLAMMASCLMFKVLSGATQDIHRYEMLRKIGVRRELLIRSIYTELGLVFLFPAILGLTHVLIGMNVFTFVKFFVNPYVNIWVPIFLFSIIYMVYYIITVQLYKRIVIPTKE